jgi:hypothetical protein
MFGRKRVIETRFLTQDEQGRVELWQSKPTFVSAGEGESFFVDMHTPENQIHLDAPINQSIADMFALTNGTCLEIRVTVEKKAVFVAPVRVETHKRKEKECLIFF